MLNKKEFEVEWEKMLNKKEFEVQVFNRGGNKGIVQIGVLFIWDLDLFLWSSQFHEKIVLPICSLIKAKMKELSIDNGRFLSSHIKPDGLEIPPFVGPLWDIPCARLIKQYDGIKDRMLGRIDVLIQTEISIQTKISIQ